MTDASDVLPMFLGSEVRASALIFLDTETTGLRPDIHVPWEIAWITAIHDESGLWLLDGFQCFRDLSDPEIRLADENALAIGGYYERYNRVWALSDVQIATRLAYACGELTGRVRGEHQVHLVGAVPSFDHAMLCSAFLGWPGFNEGLWHYHLVDVETLAAGHLGMAPPYKGSTVADALGVTISEEDRHTAMGDTRWAVDLYAAIFKAEIFDQRPPK